MTNRNFFFILVVMLALCTTACNWHSGIPVIHTNLKSDSDGIVRDITLEYRSEGYQGMKMKFEKSLGLDNVQNGYKRLQIRIGVCYSLDYRSRLLVIKTDGLSWKSELYYFRDSFANRMYHGETYIEKTELNETPEIWSRFVNTLFDMKIDKLRDFTQIPGFSLGPDEGGFFVEIAQDSFYKAYSIPTPTARRKEFEDAERAVQIMDLIDKTFGNRLRDSTYRGE